MPVVPPSTTKENTIMLLDMKYLKLDFMSFFVLLVDALSLLDW